MTLVVAPAATTTNAQRVADILLSNTTTRFAINYLPNTHEVFFAQGLYWVAYNNGTDTVYQYSKDGKNFSAPAIMRKGPACSYTTQQDQTGGSVSYCYGPAAFAMIYSSSTNTLLYVNVNNTLPYFSYRVGHPNIDGSFTWLLPESDVGTDSEFAFSPQLVLGPNGTVWLSLEVWNGTNIHELRIMKYVSSWSGVADLSTGADGGIISVLLPLSNGKMQLVYDLDQQQSTFRFMTTADGGRTWTSSYASLGTIGWGWSDSTSLGSSSYFLGWDDSHSLTLLTFNADSNTLNERTIGQPVFVQGARFSTDGNSLIVVLNDNRDLYVTQSPDSGTSWIATQELYPVDYVGVMSVPPSAVAGSVPTIWEGDYPPTYIHFFQAPELNDSAQPIRPTNIPVSPYPPNLSDPTSSTTSTSAVQTSSATSTTTSSSSSSSSPKSTSTPLVSTSSKVTTTTSTRPSTASSNLSQVKSDYTSLVGGAVALVVAAAGFVFVLQRRLSGSVP